MKKLVADVAIIGAGTAGLAAYRAVRKAGKHPVLIERGTYGTTCVKVGCMPSKLLITAANAAHDARHADVFGVHAASVTVDGPAVMKRVRQERDHFEAFVLKEVHEIPAEDRIRGHARFVDDTLLRIDDHTEIRATSVVIATGSHPAIPDTFKGLGDLAQTSDDVFEWSTLPESVAVVGTGPIGLELGQALHRLGVRVRLFGEDGRVGGLSDPAILRYAREALGREYPLHADAEITDAKRDGTEVVLTWKEDGRTESDRFAVALIATGRPPQLNDLGLENTRAPRDEHGALQADRHTLQVGDTPIFVAGDASHHIPLLHEAHVEGLIAGTNAAKFPGIEAAERTVHLSIVFSDPQIAQVGKRFDKLDRDSIVIGRADYETQGRSRIMDCRTGLLHIYADRKTGTLLGAEGIGPDFEHLSHLLAWAVQCGLRVQDALSQPYYHPTLEEGVRTALRDAASKLSGQAA